MTTAHKLCLALVAAFALALPATALAAAPTTTTAAATKVTNTGATLNGKVNPNNEPTTYYFKYGATTGYGTQTPIKGATGNKVKPASAPVTGLAPSTTYHFRLVATNASGTTTGADMTFTTGPAALTIATAAPRVVFLMGTTISGQLTGPNGAGRHVQLQQNLFPYTGGFKDLGPAITTDAAGKYAFTVIPLLGTRYRVVAKGPNLTSAEITIGVRLLVSRHVSDTTPMRGRFVRFGGSVKPAHDGQTVAIQRRTSSGRYRTVAKTVTRHSKTAGRSIYTKRFRVFSSGRYRVRVATGDGDHLKGTSRSIVITVG